MTEVKVGLNYFGDEKFKRVHLGRQEQVKSGRGQWSVRSSQENQTKGKIN